MVAEPTEDGLSVTFVSDVRLVSLRAAPLDGSKRPSEARAELLSGGAIDLQS